MRAEVQQAPRKATGYLSALVVITGAWDVPSRYCISKCPQERDIACSILSISTLFKSHGGVDEFS
jgi:hypothetical protein